MPIKRNKEVIIEEKNVNDELEFDEEEWEVRSKRVKELIVSSLKKEPEERITIDEFLNHPLFKKNLKQKNST
jgi:serine/threonine protein kinase